MISLEYSELRAVGQGEVVGSLNYRSVARRSRDQPSRARKEAVSRDAAEPAYSRSLTVAARFGLLIVSCRALVAAELDEQEDIHQQREREKDADDEHDGPVLPPGAGHHRSRRLEIGDRLAPVGQAL